MQKVRKILIAISQKLRYQVINQSTNQPTNQPIITSNTDLIGSGSRWSKKFLEKNYFGTQFQKRNSK